MKSRSAIIGPFTSGGISVYNYILNEAPFLKDMPHVDLSGLLYSNMLQAGVNLFEVYDLAEELKPKSLYLLKRVTVYSKDDYSKISEMVHDVFKSFLPSNYQKNDKYSAIWTWESFLIDLFFCVERNSAMVCSNIPSADELRDLVPPEIYYLLKNLCTQMSLDQVAVPMPQTSLLGIDAEKLKDLFESDYFATYIANHSELDHKSKPKEQTLKDILQSSVALQYNFPTILKVRDITLSVLPATAKLVDTVFGKLPGNFADTMANALNKWIKADRRIVIYETRSFLFELVVNRMSLAFNKEKTDSN
jgi:hypothetical protein